MQISDNIHADPAANLRLALKEKRYDDMAAIMKANDLRLENGRIVANEKDRKTCSERSAYWKMMQQIRKILLNSLYGALLNKHCRFYDKRLGQRCARHSGTRRGYFLQPGRTNRMSGIYFERRSGDRQHTSGCSTTG